MIIFNDWNISYSGGYVARQYDNLSRYILVTGAPLEYEWDLLVKSRGLFNTIPLKVIDEDIGELLTAEQLSIAGEYKVQLRGTLKSDTRVKRHTNIITIYIDKSISGDEQWPEVPSEFTIVENNIKELNAHPPVPGPNGYWMLWDIEQHRYVESEYALPAGAGGSYRIGDGLKLDIETNTLSVDTADKVEADNTKPITSAAVHAEVGNIEVLLAAL